ncbi:MAG TPA: tetratricopeptide repeat protein [Jatrophihabitans sp.]|uniref:tetratricopeptide repeat protein n=1 Tax=Jatrophihabitans sp. TaxID=1932789 RepID=UPI002EF48762
MAVRWRQQARSRFLIVGSALGVFLSAALAAGVSAALGAEGIAAVAIAAGAAAVGGVVAPFVIEAVSTRSSLRSAWDSAGDGIVHPLALAEDARALTESGGSPAEMLRAEREIVRFRGRPTELGDLLRWCGSAEPTAVRLCWGAAGTGKTRLARQLAWELDKSWERGFLRSGRAEQAMSVIKALDRPVLLIVDQAEGHTGLDALLAEAAAYTGRAPLRILLLARSAGDWWRRIVDRPGSLATERDLFRQAAMQLKPDAIEVTDQQQVYERALRAYAARLDRPVPDTRLVNLDRRSAPVVLSLHAAALAAVLGKRATITINSELFIELLEHEDSYWQANAARADVKLNLRQCRQVVALGTLLGAHQPADAEALLGRLPTLRHAGVPLARVADWLHDLYPAPDAQWIGPLQPDLLADALILSEISAESEMLDLIRWGLTEPSHHRRVLAFFARTAETDLRAEQLLTDLLAVDLERLAVVAMDVARDVSGPIPAVLAAVLAQAAPNPSLDVTIEKHLIEEELLNLFAELAEIVTRRQLEHARETSDLVRVAGLLNNLGNRLDNLGRYELALAAAEEAVALYRELAAQLPNAHLSGLAGALNNLGGRLSRLGQYELALAAAEEAVTLRRRLVEQRPDAYLPGLAGALANVGSRLDNLGRYELALAAAEEAVTLYRGLAGHRPRRLSA